MKTTLQHIASVQTGIYAHTISRGEIVYLQAKHFNESGELNSTIVPDLPLNKKTEKHLLQPGDILFAAKGTKNFATWYESKNGNCVASSTFLVVRIADKFKDKLLPEYLVWFINHPNTQIWLKGNAIGTSLLSISKSVLGGLEIILPTIKTQQIILKIYSLHKQELSIKKRIEELKDQYIQHLLINAINNEK